MNSKASLVVNTGIEEKLVRSKDFRGNLNVERIVKCRGESDFKKKFTWTSWQDTIRTSNGDIKQAID